MTRIYTSRQSRFVCECGVTLKQRAGMHQQGVYHLNYRRILALLKEACLTNREIGRRLGVSYERVRQIAGQVEAQRGRERQKVCTVRRRRQIVEDHPVIGVAIKTARSQGLTVATITGKMGLGSTRFVHVNGWLCYVGKCATRKDNPYYTLRRSSLDTPYDFALLYLSRDKRWMVVPRERMPAGKETMFAVEVSDRGSLSAALSHRHDYRDYIDNWQALRVAKEQPVTSSAPDYEAVEGGG